MNQNLRLSLAVFVIGVAGSMLGCEDGECLLSSDCDDGYVCQSGSCLITCSEDDPCPDGHVCTDGFCQADDGQMGGMSGAGGAMATMGGQAEEGGTEAETQTMAMPDESEAMNMPETLTGGVEDTVMGQPEAQMPESSMSNGGAQTQTTSVGGSDDDVSFGAPTEEEGTSSLFDLSGTYSVVSTVITATGGPLEEDEIEQVLIRLTKLDGFRYRVEEYDLARVERINVASSVSFAAPEGPGHYQFEYSILEAASGEGTQRSCSELETRFQRGSVRPSRGNRFELRGDETRTVSYEGEMCSAGGWETFLTTEWFPVPD